MNMKTRTVVILLCIFFIASIIPANLNIVRTGNAQQSQPEHPYGGTLRMGRFDYPPYSLNPFLEYGMTIPTICPMFSCLLRYDENGSLVSDLARSFEVSEDGLDFVFRLFENVTWHDGFPFNSSDVKFTYDTIVNDPEVRFYYKDPLATHINLTTTINATSIKFHLSNKFSPFPSYTANVPIIPEHLYSNPNYTLSTNPANENPVGTGPFQFYDWSPGQNLTLHAYEGYFRGRPYLDSLEYRWDIPIKDLGDSLQNNEIDMVATYTEPEDLERLKQVTGITTLTVYRLGFVWWGINLANPILANLTVRQAIAHAINKTRIVEVSWLGYACEATGPIPISMGDWYNPNVTRYNYNPSIAEELLDECGYYRKADGWRFDLSMKECDVVVESPSTLNMCYMLRDYLREIGINVTLELLPWGEFQDAKDSGNFELWGPIGWTFGELRDPEGLYILFHSEGAWNKWNYNNSRVDELLEQGRQIYNFSLRKEIYDEVQDIVATELPIIFLLYPQWRTSFNNDFHGIPSSLSIHPCSSLVLEEVWYEETLSGEGNCPYRVCFVDSEERRTGYSNGTAYEQIPNSTYSGIDSDPQLVKIRSPLGTYNVELIGIAEGFYEFEFVNIALDYKKVQIAEGYIHENETITYIVKVYEDGTMKVYEADMFSPHDLGITGVTSSKTVVGEGYTVSIDVSIYNYGDHSENFNITVYANTTVIQTKNITLTSGNPTTVTFAWNTTGTAKDNYTINVYVTSVLGETDIGDNTLIDGVVQVVLPGDINADHKVDMKDIGLLCLHYGQEVGDSLYVANHDVNGDGKINMKDIGICCLHYGEEDI